MDENPTGGKALRIRKCNTSRTDSIKVFVVIGRSTGDYELKKKNQKSDMIIETITALIHKHMYDQLNNSINSNDGKEIKHFQELPFKRKWTDKSDTVRTKKRPEYQKQKPKDNRCGQCGAPNWSRQHISPTKTAECRNCKRRGHFEKMCRSMKRVQYVEITTSLTEEDNWEYDRIQKINKTKTKQKLTTYQSNFLLPAAHQSHFFLIAYLANLNLHHLNHSSPHTIS